ncbi:MAG: pyridoxamine 5'-phosphate oxidase family protein [Chloroflexi bacterium]|nr:pyridoxamine 5'-phosphate oxidase family protein [Chloroflexota bacterium]
MATWEEFAREQPELAAFGAVRFETAQVAYLATVRPDGAPRVHPVTPVIGGGGLFLFMEPSSPKGQDLRRQSLYALHSLVTDQDGTNGEFTVSGEARPVEDAAVRALAAAAAPYDPAKRYVLFELSVEEAASTVYVDGQPVRRRWRQGKSSNR